MKTTIFVALAALLLGAATIAQELGKPAPEITLDHAFQGPSAAKVTLKELRGKVVVLEYWATW